MTGTLHSETLLGTAKRLTLVSREKFHSRKARISREPPLGENTNLEGVEAEAVVEEAPEVEEQLAVGTLHDCFDCQSAAQVRCLNSLGP